MTGAIMREGTDPRRSGVTRNRSSARLLVSDVMLAVLALARTVLIEAIDAAAERVGRWGEP